MSGSTETPAPASSRSAAADARTAYRTTHVFIFTSAGKPIYAHHGDPHEWAGVCALLQVLVHTPGESGDELVSMTSGGGMCEASSFSPASCPCIYFYRRDEIIIVCVYALPPPLCGGASDSLLAPPPRWLQRGRAHLVRHLLRRLHRCVLSILPTVASLLRRSPGYDIRPRHFASAEDRLLRTVIAAHDQSMSGLSDAVPTAAYSPLQRQWWTRMLCCHLYRIPPCQGRWLSYEYGSRMRCRDGAAVHSDEMDGGFVESIEHVQEDACEEDTDSSAAEVEEHVCMYSYVCYGEAVVAAVSSIQAASQAMSPRPHTRHEHDDDERAHTTDGRVAVEDAPPWSLSGADVQLLLHLRRVLLSRQPGETWAPVCVPGLNSSGYVWLYAVHLDSISSSPYCPTPPAACGVSKGEASRWSVMHVSALGQSFATLSRRTRAMARACMTVTAAAVMYRPPVAADVDAVVWRACVMRPSRRGAGGDHTLAEPSHMNHRSDRPGSYLVRCNAAVASRTTPAAAVHRLRCVWEEGVCPVYMQESEQQQQQEEEKEEKDVHDDDKNDHTVVMTCDVQAAVKKGCGYAGVAEARAQLLRASGDDAATSAEACLPLVMCEGEVNVGQAGVRVTLLALRPTRAVVSCIVAEQDARKWNHARETRVRGLSRRERRDAEVLYRACRSCIEELYIAFLPGTAEATMMRVAHTALRGILSRRDFYALEQICL